RAAPHRPRVRRSAVRLLSRGEATGRGPLGGEAAGAHVLQRFTELGDGGAPGQRRDDLGRGLPAAERAAQAGARRQTVTVILMLVKVSLVLGVAAVVQVVLASRMSAARRHL